MQVYWAPRTRSLKVLWMLEESGVSYDRIRVDLDIAPDDDDPHAILAAFDDATGEPLRSGRVSAQLKLTAASAARYLHTGEG